MKNKQQAMLLLITVVFLCQGLFGQNQPSTQQDNNHSERLAALISDNHTRRMGFDVTASTSPLLSLTELGPAATIYMRQPEQWLSVARAPQTNDGRLVSAFKFRAWREGTTVRVALYAVINETRQGANDGTEARLQDMVIEIYNCSLGETKEMTIMKEFGAKPLRLSVVKSGDLFKG